jgi:pyruvate kinase
MVTTKIVATIGPASDSVVALKEILKYVDVCRLNFSHGAYPDHLERYERIRSVNNDVAVLVDLSGPKMRTGDVEKGTVLETGQEFRISGEIGIEGNSEVVGTNYPPLIEDAKVGNHLAIDDGLLLFRVIKKLKKTNELVCEVLNGGALKSRKGINAPDVPLSLYFPTQKDLDDVRFVVRKFEQPADYFAASFVRRKEDILAIRKILDEENCSTQIISKIENQDGLKNFDEILEVSDGIMVARGDLGIEIPGEQVPIVQKQIIAKCNKASKPVIVATQMLESMTVNPRPTRAEVSDVSNAIMDGADAVMLSGETAVGKYPVETILYMEKIITEVGKNLHLISTVPSWSGDSPNIAEVLGRAVHLISDASSLNIEAIVTSTRSGSTTRMIAKNRPEKKIIAGTPYNIVKRQLQLVWGVYPLSVKVTPTYSELLYDIVLAATEKQLLKPKDTILAVGGSMLGYPAKTNQLQILKVEDVLLYGQTL